MTINAHQSQIEKEIHWFQKMVENLCIKWCVILRLCKLTYYIQTVNLIDLERNKKLFILKSEEAK